jgi:hypothetical protein
LGRIQSPLVSKAEAIMDLRVVREALRKEPFEPFVLRLADGRSLSVWHPEFVAVGKRRLVVIDEDDSWSILEPLLVVSLEQAKKTPPGGNGKKRR